MNKKNRLNFILFYIQEECIRVLTHFFLTKKTTTKTTTISFEIQVHQIPVVLNQFQTVMSQFQTRVRWVTTNFVVWLKSRFQTTTRHDHFRSNKIRNVQVSRESRVATSLATRTAPHRSLCEWRSLVARSPKARRR